VLVQFSDGSWFLVVQTLLAHHLLWESDFTRSDSVSYLADPSVLSCRFVLATARLLLIIDLFLSSFLLPDFSSLRSKQSAPDSVLPIEVMPILVLLCLVSAFLIGSIWFSSSFDVLIPHFLYCLLGSPLPCRFSSSVVLIRCWPDSATLWICGRQSAELPVSQTARMHRTEFQAISFSVASSRCPVVHQLFACRPEPSQLLQFAFCVSLLLVCFVCV
jgi:hypothetical protein